MAHNCPNCGLRCHCGGDIDDLVFTDSEREAFCDHCKCWNCQHPLNDCMCDRPEDECEDDRTVPANDDESDHVL